MSQSKRAAMLVHPRLRNSEDKGTAYCLNVEFNEFDVGRETLVLLHGYMGSIEDFEPTFVRYNRKYNLIAIDLRGHGSSSYPEDEDASWQISDLADDIMQVVDVIAPETNFSVVASSMSTAISLELARLYPEVVQSLFLMSPTAKFTIPTWIKLIWGLGKISTPKFLNGLIDTIGNVIAKMSNEHEKEFWEEGLKRFNNIDIDIHKKIFNETLSNWKFDDMGLQVPVFMIAGSDDNVITYKDSLDLLEILPKASLLTLQNTKHHIIHDKTELVLDLIDQWVSNPENILEQREYYDEHVIENRPGDYYLRKDEIFNQNKQKVEV